MIAISLGRDDHIPQQVLDSATEVHMKRLGGTKYCVYELGKRPLNMTEREFHSRAMELVREHSEHIDDALNKVRKLEKLGVNVKRIGLRKDWGNGGGELRGAEKWDPEKHRT